MDPYQPITIVEELEPSSQTTSSSSSFSWIKWVRRLIPLQLEYKIPRGRRSLELALASRPEFPGDLWVQAGLEIARVKQLLQLIAADFNLPNNHFVPQDPLAIALTTDYDDLAINFFMVSLHRTFKVQLSSDDLNRFLRDPTSTVESLVRYVDDFGRCSP